MSEQEWQYCVGWEMNEGELYYEGENNKTGLYY